MYVPQLIRFVLKPLMDKILCLNCLYEEASSCNREHYRNNIEIDIRLFNFFFEYITRKDYIDVPLKIAISSGRVLDENV